MKHRLPRLAIIGLALAAAGSLPGCGSGTTTGAAIGAAVGAAIGSSIDEQCDHHPYDDGCYYYKDGPAELETPR